MGTLLPYILIPFRRAWNKGTAWDAGILFYTLDTMKRVVIVYMYRFVYICSLWVMSQHHCRKGHFSFFLSFWVHLGANQEMSEG